jgi:Xaa-Pro aminopeptidase
MAKDPERNQSIRDALATANLRGLAYFSPVNILLLSGYWPVMGSSVAIFQLDGRVTVLLPEDEMELAETTSDAELVSYKPATLDSLRTPAEALVLPLTPLSRQLRFGDEQIGTKRQDGNQANPYPSTHHFRRTVTRLLEEAFHGTKIAAVAPGAEAKKVDTAARNVLTRYGYGDAFKHSTGHGVGFAAADPNAHPRIHPASQDVLEEGMTFNIEPAIYIEGIGGIGTATLLPAPAPARRFLLTSKVPL